MKQKLIKILKSRTFWTLISIVLLNTTNLYFKYLPDNVTDLINVLLSAIAGYFHINAKQSFVKQVEEVVDEAANTKITE